MALEINPKDARTYNNRAVTYYYLGEYDKAWYDVGRAQSLGHQVHLGFIEALRKASRREK
jgi:Flp pilus assembly protein TadD